MNQNKLSSYYNKLTGELASPDASHSNVDNRLHDVTTKSLLTTPKWMHNSS